MPVCLVHHGENPLDVFERHVVVLLECNFTLTFFPCSISLTRSQGSTCARQV